MRLTWGHRGQRSQDTKARSGIPGTHSRVGPCKVWDLLVSEVRTEHLPVHYGGCSRALDSEMQGNAGGSSAR